MKRRRLPFVFLLLVGGLAIAWMIAGGISRERSVQFTQLPHEDDNERMVRVVMKTNDTSFVVPRIYRFHHLDGPYQLSVSVNPARGLDCKAIRVHDLRMTIGTGPSQSLLEDTPVEFPFVARKLVVERPEGVSESEWPTVVFEPTKLATLGNVTGTTTAHFELDLEYLGSGPPQRFVVKRKLTGFVYATTVFFGFTWGGAIGQGNN